MAEQIEKSTIIKLREGESTALANGNYTTTLTKPVTLEQGDQVRVHTVILDTSTQDLINIANFDDNGVANGLDVSMDILRWWRFSFQHRPQVDASGNPAAAIMSLEGVNRADEWGLRDSTGILRPQSEWPTNKRYFPALLKLLGVGNADIWNVQDYRLTPDGKGEQQCGGINLDFKYIDAVTGLETNLSIPCPFFKASKGQLLLSPNKLVVGQQPFATIPGSTSPDLYPDQSSFILTTPASVLQAARITPPKFFQGVVGDTTYSPRLNPTAETYIATPFTRTLSFNIPNKRYTPGEMATYMNDRISLLDANGPAAADPAVQPPKDFNVNNAFMGTVKEMHYYVAKNHAGLRLGFFPEVDDLATDATQMLIFDVNALEQPWPVATPAIPQDFFVGAEQVDLAYDPVLQKIAFSSIHFPQYVNASSGGASGTGVPGIEWSRAPPYGPAAGQIVPDYSGASFTRLAPTDFWRNQIGFQNIIIPHISSKTSFQSNPGNILGHNPLQPAENPTPTDAAATPPSGAFVQGINVVPTVGLNITSAYQGLDLVVFKSDTFWNPQTPIPASTWAPGDVGTSSTLTTPILADREFNVSNNDEGYFLIEIGFKFPQQMVGGSDTNNTNRSYNNIQSIVGKYYTSPNNFLQDQGGGSIEYQHMGEPQMISDLSVRILNPDGSVPTNIDLGNRNTLFLEIIKAVNITTAPPPKNPIVPIV